MALPLLEIGAGWSAIARYSPFSPVFFLPVRELVRCTRSIKQFVPSSCSPSQLSKTKAESEEFVRQCAGGVAARVERLVGALQQAGREQVSGFDTHALRKNARIFARGSCAGKYATRLECSAFFHSTLSYVRFFVCQL